MDDTVRNLHAREDIFVDCMSMNSEINLAGYGVPADHFRTLAGALPTGVTVVTTKDRDGQPFGMTSGAVCSLSCEPPLLLVCMSKGSRTFHEIVRRTAFCVNVLDHESSAVSDLFASRTEDKFAHADWHDGARDLPVLGAASAHAICEVYRVIEAGDHHILIGLIVGGENSETPPLLYFRRQYAGFPAARKDDVY